VKESDPSFRKFIDRALSHCLDVIYPIVADVRNLFAKVSRSVNFKDFGTSRNPQQK
jgi:hypothetical protein